MDEARKSFCFAPADRDHPPQLRLGQESASLPPLRQRPFGRQPKTEISFVLCYNNDATNDDKKRSAAAAGPSLALGPALHSRSAHCESRVAPPPSVEESFTTCEHATRARASRVVKELMAALMRFPAAVYQVSFVNVDPSFLPFFPERSAFQFLDGVDSLCRTELASPALPPPAAASFRPPALNAPIHLAAATRTRRVISGVLYHSLRILQLPSVSRAQVAVGRSS